jgi:hypothetical protein
MGIFYSIFIVKLYLNVFKFARAGERTWDLAVFPLIFSFFTTQLQEFKL